MSKGDFYERNSSVDDKNFETEVVQSRLPVLVDFWAPWCGPCKALTPVVEELSKAYEGRIKVVKVNVEDSQKTSVKLRVRSIPTLMLYKDGKVVEQIVGNVPRQKIEDMLKKGL